MRRALVRVIALAAAVALADLVLYQMLIVPRLPRWQSVPLVWWALVVAPVVLVILVVGSRAKNLADVFSSGLVAAVFSTLYAAWAAQTRQPGHLKSLALESPLEFWLVAPAVALFAFVLLVGMTHYIAIVVRGKRYAG